jgi:hypothetical protein
MKAVASLDDDFARIGLTILRGAGLRMALSPRLSGWLSARAKGQAGPPIVAQDTTRNMRQTAGVYPDQMEMTAAEHVSHRPSASSE